MTRQTQEETTLVIGGTGKTGRRVVERLRARGLPVRVGSRSGEPPFDWEDRSTWTPVLEGVGSAYVSHHLDAVPGAAETVGSFADQCVQDRQSPAAQPSRRSNSPPAAASGRSPR